MLNTTGTMPLPLSAPLMSLTRYCKDIVEQDFDGEDMSERGCWILGSYTDGECEVLSEIPREAVMMDDTRTLLFTTAIPEMIRESQVAAAAFVLPMYYFRRNDDEPRFAIRVLAFNGIHLVDFYADASLDIDGTADIVDWAISPRDDDNMEQFVAPSNRMFYRMG
jgi:hypothetical protein